MANDDHLSLWGLFLSAFISSTLLPGGSEALLGYLRWQDAHSPWLLLLIATAGNTLGGISSWGIGRLIARRWPARMLTQSRYRDAGTRIARWGSPVLLFSWLPMIGDPLCLMAGWLRVGLLPSLLFIALGKGLRYGVVLFLVQP